LLYVTLTNIIGRAGYEAHIETGEIHTKAWQENLKEKDHLEDLGVGVGKIVKCILEK
jgi:hypothetical protein